MMNQSSILVVLQMVKKEATDIPVAEQGEAEWPYCALLDAEGMQNSSPTPCDFSPFFPVFFVFFVGLAPILKDRPPSTTAGCC